MDMVKGFDKWQETRNILSRAAFDFEELQKASIKDRNAQRKMKLKRKQPILVWRFYDAPLEYQKLSTHGGDEDWVAFIPKEFSEDWISWAQEGTPFGVCDVYDYPVEGGIVKIGAHA